MLAELLVKFKDWIVQYHEHDSLLENKLGEELTEDERKAAWDEYEKEKKGLLLRQQPVQCKKDFSQYSFDLCLAGWLTIV